MTETNEVAGTEAPLDYTWVATQFREVIGAVDNGPEGQGLFAPAVERIQEALGSTTYDQVHRMLFESALTAASAKAQAEAAAAADEGPLDRRVAIMAHHAIFSYAQTAYPEQAAANGELHVTVVGAFRRIAAGVDRVVMKPGEQ